MKEVLDIIHKTIYQFFDVCGDDEEVPMSDKDKLLLEVNKAICNNLKALEQYPCNDCISRQDVLDIISKYEESDDERGGFYIGNTDNVVLDIRDLQPVTPQPKTGHWIKYGKLYQCSECKELSCCQGKFCNECGTQMVEPKESEV